jgi:hypothetical protein
MILPLLALAALAGQALADCTRPQLQALTANYLLAQTTGNLSLLPISTTNPLTYIENDKSVSLTNTSALLATPLTLKFNLTLHDPLLCASFIEFNAASPSTPYVVLVRLSAAAPTTNTTALTLTKIDAVITSPGDWVFNATAHLAYALSESWSPIPASSPLRTPRAALQRAADAYLDQWFNSTLPVPLGTPCARLEGGMYTGARNASANTCAMPAFPMPVDVKGRRYVVDEEMGSVGVLNGFPFLEATLKPGEWTPSGNLFRVEGGLVRYIHEVTVCWTRGYPGCGR